MMFGGLCGSALPEIAIAAPAAAVLRNVRRLPATALKNERRSPLLPNTLIKPPVRFAYRSSKSAIVTVSWRRRSRGVQIGHAKGPVLGRRGMQSVNSIAGRIHFDGHGGSVAQVTVIEVVIPVRKFLSGA